MAKKAAEQKRTIQEMDVPQLQARLAELEEQKFRLQFRHASTQIKNPMEIRTARREIARVKTFMAQKSKGTAS